MRFVEDCSRRHYGFVNSREFRLVTVPVDDYDYCFRGKIVLVENDDATLKDHDVGDDGVVGSESKN